VVVFSGAGPHHESEIFEHLGVDELHLDVPAAPVRHPSYKSFATVLGESRPDDTEPRTQIVEALGKIAHQSQAKHVYLPLGVGGHVDHLLVHEAGSQVVLEAPGREILFYEDRPYAFLPGSVWIRLAQLGARLPPAAHLSLGSGIVQYLLRFQFAAYLRLHAAGPVDRFRSGRAALQHWRSARGWHPRRAGGLRLQPVEHSLDTEALTLARTILQQQAMRRSFCTTPPQRSPKRTVALPRLKRREESERYWLRLPDLARDFTLPGAALETVDSR
jgi:hypothetical protein